MIYNDRVILIYETEVDDFLDTKTIENPSDLIPCMENTFTEAEQMGLFGKYDINAFKLHLQGHYDGFSKITYNGTTRMIKGKKYHKNSTVIYV
ncbi:hypothetical protein Javan273_0017 [Streptococcus phage Javan273]|nr:hypothetical protein BKX95_00285 [Streptococcus iniae]QBX16759.1 hypothetical protein Javan273_0017 [Streptococcus phage Javan273]